MMSIVLAKIGKQRTGFGDRKVRTKLVEGLENGRAQRSGDWLARKRG